MLEVKFIHRNRFWLQPQFPDDFGICCKPFIAKCYRYSCLQLILDVVPSFVGVMLNRAANMIIKAFAVYRVW